MASASNNPDVSIRVMEEDLSCNICYNLLTEPKDLVCPHVFCLQCLEKWVGKQATIDCPECRHVTIVPQGGLINLKTNLRLKTMADKYTERVEKLKDVPMCSDHEGERQHFFCVTCCITVCNNVLEHIGPDHEIKELKIVAKTRKAEIKIKMDRFLAEMKQENGDMIKLSKMKNRLKWSADQAEKEIKKRAQETIAGIEAREKEMIACVKATYQQRLQTIQERENRATDRFTCLRNVHSATQNAVDTATDHVYMKQHASLIYKMDRLCTLHEDMPPEDMTILRFDPGSGSVNHSWFGDVAASCSKRELKLKLITKFGKFQLAQAVTVTQSGLLAVVDAADAKVVTIFRNVNGEYKRQFCLNASLEATDGPEVNLTRPVAVAATAEGKFLVSDDGAVKVFSSAGRYEISWPTSVNATSIITTPDDMVVISNNVEEVITVHQPNGELIRTHQADCERIQDLASNGNQIAFTSSDPDKVCVIDFVTGQTLWTLAIVRPVGICYDKSISILLAKGTRKKGTNLGQYVIEQYCSTTGRLISRLASGLYNPLAMAVTHDNKLVVTDRKAVKIYSIQ